MNLIMKSLSIKRILLKLISLFMLFTSNACVINFGPGPSLPYVKSNDEYVYDDSFRYPTNNLHKPEMSPNEKWFVYKHIEPTRGRRALFYSSTEKQEMRPVPLPQTGSEKVSQITTLAKWSHYGDLYAFEVEIGYRDYIEVVRFSHEGAEIIDYFEKSQMRDYYWYDNNKLAYIGYKSGIGETILIKDYSSREVKTILTGIITDNFELSDNGIFIFRRRIDHKMNNSPVSLYIGNLNNQKPYIVSRVYTGLQINDYRISPNGKYALMTLPNPKIDSGDPLAVFSQLINLEDFKIVHTFPTLRRSKWSPDGSKIAYGKEGEWVNITKKEFSFDHNFYVFDIATGKEINYGIGINNDDFCWDTMSQYIISSNRYDANYSQHNIIVMDYGIFIFRIEDGKEIGRVSKVEASNADISKNGNYLMWRHGDYSEGEHKIFVVHNQLKELM